MKYELIVGLEVHAELSTQTKIYCNCTTEFGAAPNTHCCPICIGLPGAIPVLNKKVVSYAIKAGLATSSDITSYSKQDRKNYFYPDLPKAYQTSQDELPISTKGFIEINNDKGKKKIGISRIHIEEDAGKLIHDDISGDSLVDYNRAGVPLIEIVSEPDMRSAEEARLYLESLKSILQYIEVSDCKMQEGSLRCDVNVSVRPIGQIKYGERTEMKNINSFRGVVRAIEYETKRQIDILEKGGIVEPETRRWNDLDGRSYAMRTKADSQDYMLFPEPNLAPIFIDKEWVDEIKESIPELPEVKKERYIKEYQLPEYDAWLITASKTLAAFFEECLKSDVEPKAISNWFMGDLMRILKERDLEAEEIPFPAKDMVKLISLINKGTISGTIAKKVLELMFDEAKDPEEIVKEHGLVQISDETELLEIIKQVLDDNPQSIEDYRNGRDRALGFLVGQVMRASKGKANPQMVNKFIEERIK